MIQGIGVDLIDEGRLRPLMDTPEDPFFLKTFTPRERALALAATDPLRWYAARFAAKEAVFKALRTAPEGVRLNEIEILNDPVGAPYVVLYGELARRAQGVRIHLSLSNDPPYDAAFALCETG